MSKFLSAMPQELQNLTMGFSEFLAERAAGGVRTDSVSFLDKPLSPIEQLFGSTSVRYDSQTLHRDAVRFVARNTGWREDAAFTAAFARSLEYIFTWTADIEYPELKARQLIPVNTEVNSGADYYTYRTYDKAGRAAILHNYASQSFPEADVFADEWKQAVVSLGAKYSYSIQDMRAAAMAGIPLEAKKAESARYAVERRLEEIGAYGDVATNLYGITNAPGVQVIKKVSPAGTWAQQIEAAILADNLVQASQAIFSDVTAQSEAVFSATLGVHTPTTLALPTPAYAILANTPWSPVYRDETILQYLLKSSPWLQEIVHWPYLNNIGRLPLAGTFSTSGSSTTVTASTSQAGVVYVGATLYFSGQTSVPYTVTAFNGTTGITIGVATNLSSATATQQSGLSLLYDKNPRVAQLVVPQEFEQLPPEIDGMLWKILCHMRTGGVNVMYPLAVTTMAGIS